MSGLDALLAFYRQNTKSGCTTVDRITVSYFRAAALVGRESFVDGSCETDLAGTASRSETLRSRIPAERLRRLERIVTFHQLETRIKATNPPPPARPAGERP